MLSNEDLMYLLYMEEIDRKQKEEEHIKVNVEKTDDLETDRATQSRKKEK